MLNLDFYYIDCEDKDLRDKMFITELKKYQGYYMGSVEHEHRKEVKKAFVQTLEKLGTDYLDMYLIHWPLPNPEYKDWKELDVETWRGLEELYKAGKVKAIGVSNFLLHHLEWLR